MTTDPREQGYQDGYAQGFLDGSQQGNKEGRAEAFSIALAQLRPAILQLERMMEREFAKADPKPPDDDVIVHSADVVLLKDRR